MAATILPRHCTLTYSDGIVTITPLSAQADVQVNGHRIEETTILQNGMHVRLGRTLEMRFEHSPMRTAAMPRPYPVSARRACGDSLGASACREQSCAT